MFNLQLSGQLPYRVEATSVYTGKEKTMLLKYPAIVFVTAGELQISYAEENRIILKEQFVLLPRLLECIFKSPANADIVILEIPNITSLYMHMFDQKPNLSVTDIHFFYPLQANSPILRVVESLELYMKTLQIDSILGSLKAMELFFNLKQSYSKEDLNNFFSPIQSEECSFVMFVLLNYSKVRTAEELAELSTYSLSGFNKQFNKIFGISPYKWMLQKKIDRIFDEIYYETAKPLKLIAEDYGFPNISNLGDFCRKHLGASPNTIRSRRKYISE